MASKRNSRVYADEATHHDSRPSAKDDSPQDVEEGQRTGALPRDTYAASRSRSTSIGGRETVGLGTSCTRMAKKKSAALMAAPVTRPTDYAAVPLNGRPANFGLVVPGVYRSSYPKPDDFGYLRSLKLKTVVTLVKDEVDHALCAFTASHAIRQVIFNMKGTKKETIPLSTMASILRVVLDRQNYPLLLHCNHGKHRTGCVVAVVRKLSGWDLEHVLDEYKTYATPKIRECDVDYINAFQSSSLQGLTHEPPRQSFSPVQVRVFFRTLLFSALVMAIWLVSGSHMPPAPTRTGP